VEPFRDDHTSALFHTALPAGAVFVGELPVRDPGQVTRSDALNDLIRSDVVVDNGIGGDREMPVIA
jgi:hypothetical protein